MFWVPLLLVAWAAAGLSCARLCLAAADAAREDAAREDDAHRLHERAHERELSLYEAAFLAGGPHRVAELTMIAMHRGRRLLLAHTGWATVVDPEGADDLERSVIGAIGPQGQSRIAALRHAAADADTVRALADRLVVAGLAVPDAARAGVATAVRGVRAATALNVALAAAALLMLPQEQSPPGPVAAWFALPLVLTLGCLVIARIEVYPYTRWASPAGQRLLRRMSRESEGGERAVLTAVAVCGVSALDDPALRAALGDGRMTPTRSR
ncbi:TIGR04222 domain-containing membrane protein [Streptomyces sp. NPDC000410]|uniref:TIGR04222 domain-containing membrane protein n=1 Tax=Streptomyces sp. NPDC000410 TaxID=3154254 RepID=UPI00332385D4